MPAFAGFFLSISWILASLSGWRHLAARYPASGEFVGETHGFSSARFGWVNYNHCLTVGANRDGLFVSVIFPFSVVSPPIFVPWKSLRASRVRLFFRDFVEFEVFDVGGHQGQFALPRRLAEDLVRASPAGFAIDA